MIKTCLGEVHLTKPDYKLSEILNIPKEEIDAIVEAGLGADLSAILGAEKALQMWTKTAEFFIEDMKGE